MSYTLSTSRLEREHMLLLYLVDLGSRVHDLTSALPPLKTVAVRGATTFSASSAETLQQRSSIPPHWTLRKAPEQFGRRQLKVRQRTGREGAPNRQCHRDIFPLPAICSVLSAPRQTTTSADAATVTMTMATMHKGLVPATRQGLALQAATRRSARVLSAAVAARNNNNNSSATQTRSFTNSSGNKAPNASMFGLSSPGGPGAPSSYFQKPSTPANTIIRFVPQQTAWLVERMGKFNRILEPGLAILVPFIDRIAYVKSLKENAIEIPSQSAITADNVTLELDGVLYTRVFDAYKAR